MSCTQQPLSAERDGLWVGRRTSMGATWCKERASTAQDSKSPLDRVIVRCVDKVHALSDGRSS